MASELDDVLEIMNQLIDVVECKLGTAAERKIPVASWIITLDRGMSLIKKEWHESYMIQPDELVEQKMIIDIMNMVVAGVCCLEQFSDIYPESCPWEHSFSYDDPMSVVETIVYMDSIITGIKASLWEEPQNPYYSALAGIKEMVIAGVSCILRNATLVE